jgi:2-keto-3-deoxy-L-rhamnonate aldolase RhmA
MATCDYDWLFIDMAHNRMDIDIASQISVAAQDAGITPIVRVPDFAQHHATRVLDCGAMGIVFPHVENADIAKKLVSFCLFPPKGHRSMTGSLPQLNFKSTPISKVATTINDNMLIVIMLESPEAIENVDEIAAVSGVDVILIGTNDLCMVKALADIYWTDEIKEAYTKSLEIVG